MRQIESRILAKLRLQLKDDKNIKTVFCDELWNEEFSTQDLAAPRFKKVKSKANELMFNGIRVEVPMGDIESLLAE